MYSCLFLSIPVVIILIALLCECKDFSYNKEEEIPYERIVF